MVHVGVNISVNLPIGKVKTNYVDNEKADTLDIHAVNC
jgi:hypothetical protein